MPSVEFDRLMRAARKMSDWEIQKDFEDCLVILAESEEDAEQLLRYGQARRKAPQFKPGAPGHNNHEFIEGQKVGPPASRPPSKEGLCPQSEQPSGLGACRARCSCGRGTYVRQNGTWARHAPLKASS